LYYFFNTNTIGNIYLHKHAKKLFGSIPVLVGVQPALFLTSIDNTFPSFMF